MWALVSSRHSAHPPLGKLGHWIQVKASATLITGEPYIHDIVYMLEVREDSGGSYKISKVTEMVDASLVPKAVELMQQQSGSCA